MVKMHPPASVNLIFSEMLLVSNSLIHFKYIDSHLCHFSKHILIKDKAILVLLLSINLT